MRDRVLKLFESHEVLVGDRHFYKTLSAIFLFDFLDKLRVQDFPRDWFQRFKAGLMALESFAQFLESNFEFSQNEFPQFDPEKHSDNVEEQTGQVYFKLWKDFKNEEYFTQTLAALRERFKKNGIDVGSVKSLLDDGCGGGRYALALKSLGAAKVTGIDISPNSIDLARKMSPFSDEEVRFLQGSVLDLPFEDESFDFVFSNGVLHHTLSTELGLSEIHRVLRRGGRCWLYLYGGKESLFWDIVDFSRKLLRDVPQLYTQTLMKTLGYAPGRIFHRTDFFYVPMNRRYFTTEVESMLRAAGFQVFRRLKRGTAYDWDEINYRHPNLDRYIYGEGEMRYLINRGGSRHACT